MIRVGTQPMLLQDPAGDLCRYIEQWHSLELMQLFATPPAVNMQRGRNLLYPNYPPLPPPRVNQLIIPTGATRWGYGLFLTDDDGKDSVLAQADAEDNRMLPVEFWSENDWQEAGGLIDPDKKPVKFRYFMTPLHPRPISPRDDRRATVAGNDHNQNQGLWLIPMVDSRYFWQNKHVGSLESESITSLSEFVSFLETTLTETILLRCVDGAYTDGDYLPDILSGNNYENAAMILETLAWHIGCQLVPAIHRMSERNTEFTSQQYALLSVDGSEFICEDNLLGYIGLPDCSNNNAGFGTPEKGDSREFVGTPALLMGGEYDDQSSVIPETVLFPTENGNFTDVDASELKDTDGNELVTSGVASGTSAVLRLKYKDASTIPASIEKQAALDYFWRFRRQYDYTFAGVQPWQPTAFDDFVVFCQDYYQDRYRVQTRVRSWFQNLLPERHQLESDTDEDPGGSTGSGSPCEDCTNCLDPSTGATNGDCSEVADQSPDTWYILFDDSFCCIDSENDINIALEHDADCTWSSDERECTERFIEENWLDGVSPNVDEDIFYTFTLTVGATWATLTLQFYRKVPSENIASYTWRIRTDEWSALCDNKMLLDNTDGLVDSPMRQNSIGVCRPPCSICVTPFGTLESNACATKIFTPETVFPIAEFEFSDDLLTVDPVGISNQILAGFNRPPEFLWDGMNINQFIVNYSKKRMVEGSGCFTQQLCSARAVDQSDSWTNLIDEGDYFINQQITQFLRAGELTDVDTFCASYQISYSSQITYRNGPPTNNWRISIVIQLAAVSTQVTPIPHVAGDAFSLQLPAPTIRATVQRDNTSSIQNLSPDTGMTYPSTASLTIDSF